MTIDNEGCINTCKAAANSDNYGKKDLKPAGVFHYFEEICQVPRPSKKEEKIIAYLKAFGEKHKLETKVDEAGNVLIKKPATPGMENRKTVVLQSHIDMVCEKEQRREARLPDRPYRNRN